MATITSQQDGNWSSTSTWVGGQLPQSGDLVVIDHNVIMDLNETDGSILYGRVTVNQNKSLVHADGTTCFCINAFLYIYGKYEMKPGSTLKFHQTSRTSTTEGLCQGLYARGDYSGCQLILNGSVPLPETYLTSQVSIGDYVLHVNDQSGFSKGEYISVYYDMSNDVTFGWDGKYQSDEGFIVHHVSGNDIYIQLRVQLEDTLSQQLDSGSNIAYVNTVRKWNIGSKIFIDDELFVVSDLDEDTGKLTFTQNQSITHSVDQPIVESGQLKSHLENDKVYKIATVLTQQSDQGTNTITVQNQTMLNIGDRVIIEGYTRTYNKEFETTIQNKVGNTLTLDQNLPYVVYSGFIVTKTNRDCVITTTDPTLDQNRFFVYYVSGSTGLTDRKLVLRYAEFSHIGNSGSSTYSGFFIRGDWNRTDTEAEMRGCVIRDGISYAYNSIWISTTHYIHFRNNVTYRLYIGVWMYSAWSGTSIYNHISIGSLNQQYRYEQSAYYNQFQYNIGLNTPYGLLNYSDYNQIYPEWHNIFKHTTYSLYFSNSTTGSQYGTWIRNKYEDYYYQQGYIEGIRQFTQDLIMIPQNDQTYSNWSSDYSDYDTRGLVGGMIIFMNINGVRRDFQMHHHSGIIYREESVHMGNGWSYRFRSNVADQDLRISQMVQVKQGYPLKVVQWMRKSSTYNGTVLPRIVVRGLYHNSGAIVYQEMEDVVDKWVPVDLEIIPEKTELMQIGVGGRGTNSVFYVDPRVVVTTHDRDLITGPYSVNLMFGLDQQGTDDSYQVRLGGAKF